MKVLAGDIGGTKILLQIAEVRGTHIKKLHQERFSSQDYPDFETLLSEYLAQAPANLRNTITGACFGIAGPIIGPEQGPRRANVTNLPWQIDETNLQTLLKLTRVRLINDFYATASGIEALDTEDFAVLNVGTAQSNAPRLVVGAGTGLGVAQLFWCDGRYRAFSSEGGHIHYAATTPMQIELLRYLKRNFDRVSYERLVSGAGLTKIYRFLLQRDKGVEASNQEVDKEGEDAATITARARTGEPLATEALSLFLSIYGAAVGDLALVTLAHGGVYVAGGIAPKILEEMRNGTFMEAYSHKGRMSNLVDQMPVFVVLSEEIGLLGATLVASQL
jgi:glucokinase